MLCADCEAALVRLDEEALAERMAIAQLSKGQPVSGVVNGWDVAEQSLRLPIRAFIDADLGSERLT